MNHPTKPQWARLCDQIRLLADRLEHDGPALFDRDRHTAQADGYPASSLGGDGRSSSPGSSTETAALADTRPDHIHDDAANMARLAQEAVRTLGAAVGCVTHAERHSTDQLKDHGPAGMCEACQRAVAGTATDRLRSGYCDRCRKAWDRAGRPDRLVFNQSRRDTAA